MERDCHATLDICLCNISTHTLTWSVTSSGVALYSLSKISTHTLTWSVTRHRFFDHFRYTISTHTLTWSVTTPYHQTWYPIPDFNSHAHVERDLRFRFEFSYSFYFNSHAHVERDMVTLRLPQARVTHFNSHAHVERDLTASAFHSAVLRFQLTRSRGA